VSTVDHDLAMWVMANVHPFSRWQWIPAEGGPAVILVINSYRSNRGYPDFNYDIEIGTIYVVVDDREVEVWPHPEGELGVPDWYLVAIEPSSFAPSHIRDEVFRAAADTGGLTRL
jgi:hypothetical protein